MIPLWKPIKTDISRKLERRNRRIFNQKGQNTDQNWTKIVYFDSKTDVLHKNGTHGMFCPDFVRG